MIRVNSDPAKREQRYDLMVRRSYARYRRRVRRHIAAIAVAYAGTPGSIAKALAVLKEGDTLIVRARREP